jgi:hypothetical protein
MKRHRILSVDFDTRVRVLVPIEEQWDESVKELHRQNREHTLGGLRQEFGEHQFEQKLANFIELGPKSFSVVAFHNRFFAQARSAFVHCLYYPALTAICALGERVLNYLVIGLRDNFRGSEIYKRVYRKDSFDNWDLAIAALSQWKVLTPQAETAFRVLWQHRNDALHFNPETDANDRPQALQALQAFGQIVDAQFAAFGQLPWLFVSPGEVYIRKEWELDPFIKLVYVPNTLYVGYKHIVTSAFPWVVQDPAPYADEEVSDEEFTRLRTEFQGLSANPSSER